jgi:hypothetical protein
MIRRVFVAVWVIVRVRVDICTEEHFRNLHFCQLCSCMYSLPQRTSADGSGPMKIVLQVFECVCCGAVVGKWRLKRWWYSMREDRKKIEESYLSMACGSSAGCSPFTLGPYAFV